MALVGGLRVVDLGLRIEGLGVGRLEFFDVGVWI